jgi:orotate phosphoribosyltransferase
VLQQQIVDLMSGTRGHFRFESGHHGELWLELDSLFVRPEALARPVAELARRLSALGVEAVCGPLVGGAFLAQMLAARLEVEFYYSQPSARPRRAALYSTEYRLPAAVRERVRGRAVAVVDDVINAGSAPRATLDDLRQCGARVIAISALLTLGSAAAALADAEGVALEALAEAPNTLWAPAECPLCAAGTPLDTPPVAHA